LHKAVQTQNGYCTTWRRLLKVEVRVKLKYGLDRVLEKDVVVCEINSGEKVADLLERIRFPLDRAGAVLVDGKRSHNESLLFGGEIIKIFPADFNKSTV
jgi:hypothetical protein